MLFLLIGCIAMWHGEIDPDSSMPEGTRCWIYGQYDDHSITCQFPQHPATSSGPTLNAHGEDDCPCERISGTCPCQPPYGE